MQLIFLGSSDEHGVPRVGCECQVCQDAHLQGSRNQRTFPSVALRYGPTYGERLVLLGVTPEFRLQAARQKLARFDALLLSHSHDAQILGLGTLLNAQREVGQALAVYAPPQVLEDARERLCYVWNEKSFRRILQPEGLESAANLWGLEVRPLRVDHGVGGTAFGYLLAYDGLGLAYVPDMLRVTPDVRQALTGLDLLVLGASHYYEGREMWKRSVMDVMAALELIREVSPGRAILTHLSHTVDYEEVSARLPASTSLAYDGLAVEIGA